MDLEGALAFSRYAQRALASDPQLRPWLDASLEAPFDWADDAVAIAHAAAGSDADALGAALRRCRRRLMLHTLSRDLTGRASLTEVCGAVTRLAEVAIGAATDCHHRALAVDVGEPIGAESGARQRLCVVGMGKLGGGELNVSSDVDLVFLYPEEGETAGPRRIANREFFERLGRRVIAALHEVTAHGHVFRVDMRLRPYGDSGPLAVPFGALEQYLLTQGRAWERYAWLKARALTGGADAELAAIVDPFVFRKYLDYDAYAGLRGVHRQIRAEGARRDYARNVKLGEGGIREIEFIVQAIQIVRGGREGALRLRGTLPALATIEARALLPRFVCARLREAYIWLRDVEHRLQYRDDQQTQSLPDDDAERTELAFACGQPGLVAFDAKMAATRAAVVEHFVAVLGEAPEESAGSPLATAWDAPELPSTAELLAGVGFASPEDVASRLRTTRQGLRYQQLPALSRERFDTLVPRLLDAAAQSRDDGHDANAVFPRLMDLLEAVSRRSAYLALLIEHPPLLPRLANLMGASAWAAAYLTRHPILLDELLDARILFAEADWATWRSELETQLAAAGEDPERQMDALRHFQHAQLFRLLVQDLAGHLTVERLADHLSALADVVIAATLHRCWVQMCGRDAPSPRFAVAAYGKLGGKELGYASDLDLVFLYDVDESEPDADLMPERYARLAQRLITWLTSTTGAGQLYDTDLRLRPDGAAGLLVSSLRAFRRYQHQQAWTWEHQALTRARFVAGDAAIGAAFETERDAILRIARDPVTLAADVLEMRRRMHDGHPNPSSSFDLKHDAGGMIDVEFAVQYLVLAHSHAHPALTRNAGNIALLAMAGELGLVPAELAAAVADAYRDYRRQQHAVRLTGAAHARVDPAPQEARRAAVRALWHHVFGAPRMPAAA